MPLNRGQEELKIEGKKICLGEELGRKYSKNNHSSISCKIKVK